MACRGPNKEDGEMTIYSNHKVILLSPWNKYEQLLQNSY